VGRSECIVDKGIKYWGQLANKICLGCTLLVELHIFFRIEARVFKNDCFSGGKSADRLAGIRRKRRITIAYGGIKEFVKPISMGGQIREFTPPWTPLMGKHGNASVTIK
jgi:hypothetical protein